MNLADKIIAELDKSGGLSDRQLSEAIFGTRYRGTQINGECHYMESCGSIERRKQAFGPILNFLKRLKPIFRVV